MSLVETETIFGRIVTGGDVEDWCLAVLQRWMGTYLSEVELQHGLAAGTLQRPRSWSTAPSFDKWPEEQLPAVVLVCVGLAEPPHPDGRGVYRARWSVVAYSICSARTQAESHRMAQTYAAGIRTLLLHRPGLEGRAAGMGWSDEGYDDLPFDDTRSLAVGQATFIVDVDDVVTSDAGPSTPDEPLDPDTDPWALWPLVESHEVVVEHDPPAPLGKERRIT